ncbi:iron chaperone [Bacillus sp. JJ664]
MEVFTEYLEKIENPIHRDRTEEVLTRVINKFPNLMPKIAWNQPMFTDHDTYIIGFSVSKQHLAVAPETVGINHFSDEIVQAGYDHTKQLVRIPWGSSVDYNLIEKMIEFNILDKKDCTTFWRK